MLDGNRIFGPYQGGFDKVNELKGSETPLRTYEILSDFIGPSPNELPPTAQLERKENSSIKAEQGSSPIESPVAKKEVKQIIIAGFKAFARGVGQFVLGHEKKTQQVLSGHEKKTQQALRDFRKEFYRIISSDATTTIMSLKALKEKYQEFAGAEGFEGFDDVRASIDEYIEGEGGFID